MIYVNRSQYIIQEIMSGRNTNSFEDGVFAIIDKVIENN